MHQGQLPPGWPTQGSGQVVQYTPKCIYHDGLGPQQLILAASSASQAGVPSIHTELKRPNVLVSIRLVDIQSHPAYGQRGLFAKKPLAAGELITDYVGSVHRSESVSQTSDYVLALTPEISIDAEFIGNEARFINDYRGVAQRANAEFRQFKHKASGELRMGVFALVLIPKGSEICLSYGKSFWKSRGLLRDG